MKFSERYTKVFQYLLPAPFTIAVLLSLLTFLIAFFFSRDANVSPADYAIDLMQYWEAGIWNNGLMVFAMQMMLMLVLGHVLALTPSIDRLLNKMLRLIHSTASAVFWVSLLTMLVALFNWGLGLIFGALFARKVGEHAHANKIPLNYPMVGAAGYVGLMVWHGGISGSSLSKIAESGHLKIMMQDIFYPEQLASLPQQISLDETVFSSMNLCCIALLLILVPLFLYRLGKRSTSSKVLLPEKIEDVENELKKHEGAERLDHSVFLAKGVGIVILFYAVYKAFVLPDQIDLQFITPNFINLSLLGLGLLMHRNFVAFLKAVDGAIGGAAGILIQFPLYFGIMGIMKSSGLVNELSSFFVSISSETSFPLYTLFSAALVNIFVPSGGGQWAIQGPIIVQATADLGISLPKSILALAYGDQLTNMLQPFWALPLLGITGLKAKEILPYTLLLMLLGLIIYVSVLLLF